MENLRRLLPYLRPHLRTIVIASVCMLISGLLGGAFLFLAELVLRPMLNSQMTGRIELLNYFTLLVLLVSIGRVAADFGQVYLTQRTGQRVLTRLREELFVHFQRLSVGFFERRRTGEIMSRMTNDLAALQGVMTLAVATAISSPVELVIAVGYMFYRNWRLALFVMVILPPVAFLINHAGRRIRFATTNLQEQLANLTDYLQEKIAAMRLIQTFGAHEHEISLFNRVNQAAYSSTMKPVRIQAALAPVIEFTGMMGVMLSLWFGGRDVIAGRMPPEALITFLFAVHRAAMRAKALAGLNLMFKQADAAAARLFEILDTEPEIRDRPGARVLDRGSVRGHLAFEDVRFHYPGGPEVLHGLSFEIKPGEVVALAGLSGSGKTTIAALVPRLYDPTGGCVRLDGCDLRDLALHSLRAHIGAVPQETTLFHGTIRDNIAYGKPEAGDDEIMAAARRAYAADFIESQPQGFLTHIGERGSRLSGGQRQRLAIARALLRDPRILILDEATSSLDAESETEVQRALAVLMEGRTTLVIAHRFSTIQNADRILVLESGSIVESGPHAALLSEQGLYYRLYQMQNLEQAARRSDSSPPDTPAPCPA